jgi:hypothetical protein
VIDATGVRGEDPFSYCVEGDRFTLGPPNGHSGACPEGGWTGRWQFDGDELRFVDLEVDSTNSLDDMINFAIFASHPWLRIGDVPSPTDSTAVGVDTFPTES